LDHTMTLDPTIEASAGGFEDIRNVKLHSSKYISLVVVDHGSATGCRASAESRNLCTFVVFVKTLKKSPRI